jgi:hypothetical protein
MESEAARAEYKRQHYLENKEKYKKRYLTFKEKHKEMLKVQHNCECGGVYRWATKAIHRMSKRHVLYLHQVETSDAAKRAALKEQIKVEIIKHNGLKSKLEMLKNRNEKLEDAIKLYQVNTIFKKDKNVEEGLTGDADVDADTDADAEEKSNAEWAIQHNCPCGGVYTKSTRNIHNRSKRHILMVDPSMKVVFPKVMLWN